MSCSATLYFSAAKSVIRFLITDAAACAAQPLRSEPVEPAVGDVLGTSPVEVGDRAILSMSTLKDLGNDLRDLDEEALPHFGAAVTEPY